MRVNIPLPPLFYEPKKRRTTNINNYNLANLADLRGARFLRDVG